jgi:hypothetical protein
MTEVQTRFVSIPHPLPITMGDTTCCVIVADAGHWMGNQDQIVPWLDVNAPGWERQGMVLTFPDDDARLMFMMRWAWA